VLSILPIFKEFVFLHGFLIVLRLLGQEDTSHLPRGHLSIMTISIVVLLNTSQVSIHGQVHWLDETLGIRSPQAWWDGKVTWLVELRVVLNTFAPDWLLSAQKLTSVGIVEVERDARGCVAMATCIDQLDTLSTGWWVGRAVRHLRDLPVSGDLLDAVVDWGTFGALGDIVLTSPSLGLVVHSWKVPVVGWSGVSCWNVFIVPESELEMILVDLVFPRILVLVEKDVLMMATGEASGV